MGFSWNVEDEPVHQPDAPDAPIPGRHWYSGCDPDRPTVGPDGRCRGCGEVACRICGRENCPDHTPAHQPEPVGRRDFWRFSLRPR